MREKINPHLLEEIKQTDTGQDCLLFYFSEEDENQFNPLDFEHDGDFFLHMAARRGDYQAVQLLLEAAVDVNKLGDMGQTALHYAKQYKHEDIVRLLLEYGASTEIRNEFGKLPLEDTGEFRGHNELPPA